MFHLAMQPVLLYTEMFVICVCCLFGVQWQQPAVNVLREIQVFLENNKDEVVTIIIEDYVKSPKGLTKVFDTAGLRKFMFPVSRIPKNGGDWPTLDDMIRQNQRLLVFTSDRSKEATEGIAYQWTYMVENQCESLCILQTILYTNLHKHIFLLLLNGKKLQMETEG